MTTDTVSGAEVPEPEIAVSLAMIEAGVDALWYHEDRSRYRATTNIIVQSIYRAMRRVEIAEARAAQSVPVKP